MKETSRKLNQDSKRSDMTLARPVTELVLTSLVVLLLLGNIYRKHGFDIKPAKRMMKYQLASFVLISVSLLLSILQQTFELAYPEEFQLRYSEDENLAFWITNDCISTVRMAALMGAVAIEVIASLYRFQRIQVVSKRTFIFGFLKFVRAFIVLCSIAIVACYFASVVTYPIQGNWQLPLMVYNLLLIVNTIAAFMADSITSVVMTVTVFRTSKVAQAKTRKRQKFLILLMLCSSTAIVAGSLVLYLFEFRANIGNMAVALHIMVSFELLDLLITLSSKKKYRFFKKNSTVEKKPKPVTILSSVPPPSESAIQEVQFEP